MCGLFDSMSELSGFVYIKSHVTLHVKSKAQKVNRCALRKGSKEIRSVQLSTFAFVIHTYLSNGKCKEWLLKQCQNKNYSHSLSWVSNKLPSCHFLFSKMKKRKKWRVTIRFAKSSQSPTDMTYKNYTFGSCRMRHLFISISHHEMLSQWNANLPEKDILHKLSVYYLRE